MIIRPIDMRKLALVVLATVFVSSLSSTAFASITGTLIDSDAKPVAGATIRAYAAEDSAALRARLVAGKIDREPVATAKSSETGSFSIDVKTTPAVDIVIESDGHPRTTISTIDGDDLGAIQLLPPPTTKFRVTSGGQPVANAIVVSGTEVSRTDAAGEVPGFGFGSAFVVHPDYAVGSRRDMGNGASTLYEIKLSRGVAVSGRVVNAVGPVAHAIVSINGWPLAASADDGTFTVAHAPENWQSVSAVRGNEIGAAVRPKTGAAVEIRLSAGASFTGTLRDTKSGAAVAGARMSLSAVEDRSPVTVTSDAKGVFTFAPLLPHAYQIEGMHPAYAIEPSAVIVPHVSTRAFAALPFARARGRVIDEEKKPVAAAVVNSPSTNGTRRQNALTNAAGEFVLRVMPQAALSLPIYAMKRNYAGGMSEARKWQPGETRDNIVITLEHGFVVKVRVIDQQRQPVPRAYVNVTRTGENGQQGFFFPAECLDSSRPDCRRSGADGSVSFRTAAGLHAVFVTGDDIAPKRLPREMLTAKSEPVVVTVDRGVEISGHVLHSDGSPVADAIVEMPSANMAPRTATSDSDGSFKLGGIPSGATSVTAFSADRRLSSQAVAVTAPAKGVTITMPNGARIEGRVVDRATKQPVTDFTIALPAPASPGRGAPGAQPQQFHAEDGSYAIDNVTPGSVQIRVTATGYVAGSRSDIAAEDGKTVSGIDVQLDRGATVTGKVTSSGAPVAGVQVQVTAGRMPPSGNTTTDADGSYTIDGIQEGDRTLQFQKTGFVVQRKSVEVTAGKELRLDVELDHGRELRGRVVDRTGTGIAGGMVAINGNGNVGGMPGNITRTEADGTFVMQGVADGRYRLTARKEGYVSAEANDVEVPQVQALTFTLDNGATITGRVTGLTPDELPQVIVGASGGTSRNQTNVDQAGNFTLHGLPDGSVRVDAMLNAAGRRRTAPTKMIVVENGAAPPVELNFDEGMTVSGHVTRAGVAVSMGNLMFTPAQLPGGGRPPQGSGRQFVSAMISPDGSYVASGLASGDYDVRVAGPNLSYQTRYTAGGNATFDIDIRGAMLRGHVVDAATGAPVAGATVSAGSRTPGSSGSAASDSEGHFAIDALADNTYDLRVSREPYATTTQQVVVSGGSASEVEVRLEKAPAVTFHAVDSVTGAPVDATVFVATPAHTNPTQATRVDTGEYKAWLQPGSYIATAFTRFYTTIQTPFTAPTADVRLSLVHGGQLIINAKSAQQVRLDPAGTAIRVIGPIHEGINGPYPTMAPGSYVLSILSKTGGVASTMPVAIVAGETTTIQLP
ncbi:MAG: large repetitive protein [Thermoanaerobaculia bacterium]|jgi:protocatechuate 3,4-dioxygenase beta subunit|nr:large repetitive protein [Thermoanaerobaculia bacterium]